MLLQFPCGDCVRCNGLFGGTFPSNCIEIREDDCRRCDQASSTRESTSVGSGHAFHRRGQSTSRVHFRGNPNDGNVCTEETPASWILAPKMNS